MNFLPVLVSTRLSPRKPRGTLKPEDSYKTKIKIAAEIITELVEVGFNIEVVLADSLYGEAKQCTRTLDNHNLSWIVAIRDNHGVWMPQEEKVRKTLRAKIHPNF
ncbi:MAG: hypothetical protein F6K45_19235 [Kamptonema sp. SIO1D9]|nr:hypothetical protein [Kamptonema sp. SIO1D9]